MILVDPLADHRGMGRWCHMVSDKDLVELHEFADRLGLSRGWFQGTVGHPHYDLTPGKRATAIKMGASPVSSKALVKAMWALYGRPGLGIRP